MKQFAYLAALVLTGSFCPLPAQEAGKPTPEDVVKARSKDDKQDGVTYGRIKEVKAGQKIVVAVDGAPDKTYNLADAKRTITLAEGLAIGDPVKVMGTDKKGAKTVQIVRDIQAGSRSRDRK